MTKVNKEKLATNLSEYLNNTIILKGPESYKYLIITKTAESRVVKTYKLKI